MEPTPPTLSDAFKSRPWLNTPIRKPSKPVTDLPLFLGETEKHEEKQEQAQAGLWMLTADDLRINRQAPYFWISYIAAQGAFMPIDTIEAKIEYGSVYINTPYCQQYGTPWVKRTPPNAPQPAPSVGE